MAFLFLKTDSVVKMVEIKGNLNQFDLFGTGTIQIFTGGQLHINNNVYIVPTIEVKMLNMTRPEEIHLPSVDLKRFGYEKTSNLNVLKHSSHIDHNEMLLDDGEDLKRWESHVKNIEIQGHQQKYNYVTSTSIATASWITAVIMIFVYAVIKIRSSRTSNRTRPVTVEDIEMMTIPPRRINNSLIR